MNQTGLVLEGGGMRGVYTAGVLRYLMEKETYLPYVIGVSAGACNGSSYVARQMDRNKIVNIDYIKHPEYISFKRFLSRGELFGMDFIFDKLPNDLEPFDFQAFRDAEEKFIVGTTDCMTGESVYFDKQQHYKNMLTILRASSSIPMMAPIINYEGRYLLDGAISDPIPILKSEKDGNSKNVVVLTRNKGYLKKQQSFSWYIKRKYSQYEGLLRAMMHRHNLYNETVSYLEEQEAKGNIFIIRPEEKLDVGRIERNPAKLNKLFERGYNETMQQFPALKEFLS
ncbi:Predicted phospholipase, patatin/cPLA2 family [Bacillus sp. OV322]|uniref:patatin-like phospholipase family protein n=1 Tax=Bacillus sp. OV322 TaxID=1882764 RepID=UPI0008F1111A|nr:patatin family protein [Bacillus sp. OV322]SFC69786.1 Predicted phospholipase, patatin/cPLA2 family [Bacillus sp. OV322]